MAAFPSSSGSRWEQSLVPPSRGPDVAAFRRHSDAPGFQPPNRSTSTVDSTQDPFHVLLGQGRTQEALRPFRVPGPERVLALRTRPDVDPALKNHIGSIPIAIVRSHRRPSLSAPHLGLPASVKWWDTLPALPPWIFEEFNDGGECSLRQCGGDSLIQPKCRLLRPACRSEDTRELNRETQYESGVGAKTTTLSIGWESAKFSFLCQCSDLPPYRCLSYRVHLPMGKTGSHSAPRAAAGPFGRRMRRSSGTVSWPRIFPLRNLASVRTALRDLGRPGSWGAGTRGFRLARQPGADSLEATQSPRARID